MNPVNGPVLVVLLIALVVLVFFVDAQRRAINRTRASLHRQQARTRVLREKLDAAEAHTCLSYGHLKPLGAPVTAFTYGADDEPVPFLPAELWTAARDRHPATRAGLRVVGGGS